MIRMHGAEGSTELTEQIREDLWVVASKLSCLADLAAVRTPVDVELDSIVTQLAVLRQMVLGFLARIQEVLVCTRAECTL
jgi:hypothetical protein